MRVALFFDGKNHIGDLRRTVGDVWIDYRALADWVVGHLDGSSFIAAYYYTGTPKSENPANRHSADDLFNELEQKPGFFVKRSRSREVIRECPHCKRGSAHTEEKAVGTALVADMIVLAVRDVYDTAVIFSNDLDVVPGIEAVHSLGKKAWVASFGASQLPKDLVRAAWGQVPLLDHLDAFSFTGLRKSVAEPSATYVALSEVDSEMLRELSRAETHFNSIGGFVGAHYFVHRWKGHGIPDLAEDRRQVLQRLVDLGQVDAYEVDGKTALRLLANPLAEGTTRASGSPTLSNRPPHADQVYDPDDTDTLRTPKVFRSKLARNPDN